MKLVTYAQGDVEGVGVLDSSGARIIPVVELGMQYRSMNELIENATKGELARLSAAAGERSGELLLSEVYKMAPIPRPRQDVICVGFNYIDHVREADHFDGISSGTPQGEVPEWPTYFSKRVNEATPDDGLIKSNPSLDECLDYEVELGVIIRHPVRNISPEEVEKHIFGYTIINDISARTIQGRYKQFYFGKSLDTSCPMGPWIITRDELPFPLNLDVHLYVNGELRQHSNTGNMIFGIERVVSELSQGMTLRPGTIISTGTCAGTGAGLHPPKWLKPGDMVECVIEGIGRLRNKVV